MNLSSFRLISVPALALLICWSQAPVAVSQSSEPGLVAWWDFAPHRQQGTSIKAAYGGPNISPSGSYRIVDDPPPTRVELSGVNESLVIAGDVAKVTLPKMEMSAEAWVRVDATDRWGGILCAIQDNGDYERGWVLGTVNDRFSFALTSEEKKRLTYLEADEPVALGHWAHVVGTYDGAQMKLYVNGRLAGVSDEQTGPIAYPPRAPFVAGAYQDDDEHYRLQGAIHEIRLFQQPLSAESVLARYMAKKSLFPEPAPEPILLEIAYGPFIDWIDRHTAVLSWETDLPMPTTVDWTGPTSDQVQRLGSPESVTEHQVMLTGLKPETEFHYRIHGPAPEEPQGKPVQSKLYLFDSSFFYAPTSQLPDANRVAAEEPHYEAFAKVLLAKTPLRRGYAYVLGAEDGRLALELVRHTQFKVIVVDPDARRIQNVRRLLDRAGVYGVRAAAHQVSEEELPFGPMTANLVVSESLLINGTPPPWSAKEVQRLIRPITGTLLFGAPNEGFPGQPQRVDWERWAWKGDVGGNSWMDASGTWLLHKRPALEGAGEWSHQYGSPDNSGTSMDEWVRGDLNVAWWGDPGPRPMPDRGNRNPAPLSVNGRLFIQGDRVLFGLDAYNGAILWTVSSPEMRRANVPRDSSNMVANEDTLYLAQGRWAIAYDGATGNRRQRYEVPVPNAADYQWGYLAFAGGQLLGTPVKKASTYLGDDGEWYEDFHPEQVSRVTSDRFFALDPVSGQVRWTYQNGVIMNSTITVGDDMVFFIESRNPVAVQADRDRQTPEDLTDTWLVALDLKTGRRLWHKAQDFSDCEFMTYLVYSENTVLVTGTDRRKHFHSYAFHAPPAQAIAGSGDAIEEAEGGRMLWQESHKEDKGHHSGHLQHPLVIDGVFYSDQRAFGLRSGELLREDLPERRGCGVMSASRYAVFFRHHFHGMWDLESDNRSQFEGIRGGCWLGLIPAGGFLLAPESSAGCSCTHAIQTSVGYIPQSLGRR